MTTDVIVAVDPAAWPPLHAWLVAGGFAVTDSPAAADDSTTRHHVPSPDPIARTIHTGLIERELHILTGFAAGKTNAAIGRERGRNEDAVKSDVRKIFRKLGARDRAHAVAIGYRLGIFGGTR